MGSRHQKKYFRNTDICSKYPMPAVGAQQTAISLLAQGKTSNSSYVWRSEQPLMLF